MKFNPEIHHRKSIRLKEYDYSRNGYYFVTICTKDKQCIFGDIIDEKLILNEFGKIVKEELLKTEIVRKEIKIDYFLIMPNHVHAIIIIDNDNCKPVGTNDPSRLKEISSAHVGANGHSPLRMRPKSLSSLIVGFKSSCKIRINDLRNTPGIPVWQRNYYEHVIRNDRDLYEIRKYIENNPLEWYNDEYYITKYTECFYGNK